MTKRIIFDADLTMGVPDCDVDDGLALLFALGYEAENKGSVHIEGLCASYGNSTIDIVFPNAQKVCSDLSLDFPVLKGAADKSHPESDAARFLVETANAHPGEISLSVTGSTTNLKGAMRIDPDVLTKFREIVFMGGITRSLVFNGKIMDELNLSCDAEATRMAFATAEQGTDIVVMTANNCLPAHYMPDEFSHRLKTRAPDGGYLWSRCRPWFETMERWYGEKGFCCWDVLTSAYLLEPELFTEEYMDVVLDERLLSVGFLEPAFAGAPQARIKVPQISDAEAFCMRTFELWRLALESRNMH